jgi:hypothetical protein
LLKKFPEKQRPDGNPFKTHLHTLRWFRLLAVAGILSSGIWVILGVAVMATAIIGWCPVRAALGLSSCREEEKLPVDTSGEHTERKPQNRLFK